MTIEAPNPTVPRGDTQSSSGGTTEQNGSSTEETRPNSVSYETHRKLLAEKKKRDEDYALAQSKIAEYERLEREREEQALTENNQWKELAERRSKEAEDALRKAKELEERDVVRSKLDAFVRTAGFKVEPKYLHLIDLDAIAIDPSTGRPDEGAVADAVKEFEKEHPSLIVRPSRNQLPPHAPQGSGSGLTREEWLKLSPKEMEARLPEMLQSLNRT